MNEVIDLLMEQRKIELNHVEVLSESKRDLKHPMARVILEAIIYDSMKHAAVAQALIDVGAGEAPVKLDLDMGPAVSLHQNIKQHVRAEENMIALLGEIYAIVEEERVKSFIDYLIEEEKRHHTLLKELSNLIDRDSVTIDEYVGLFQKYMIVSPP